MKEQEILTMLAEMAKEDGSTEEDLLAAIKAERHTKKQSEAVNKDVEKFKELFPDVLPADIPEEVWEEVGEGTSLCSAYALYLCKTNGNQAKAHYVNEENMRRSAPAGKEADAEQTFTPELVEDMSAENVKKNFKNIIRSIKNWKL